MSSALRRYSVVKMHGRKIEKLLKRIETLALEKVKSNNICSYYNTPRFSGNRTSIGDGEVIRYYESGLLRQVSRWCRS